MSWLQDRINVKSMGTKKIPVDVVVVASRQRDHRENPNIATLSNDSSFFVFTTRSRKIPSRRNHAARLR